MNGRKLFREYAQSKGKEAKEFVKIKGDWYDADTLVTKDSKGNIEETAIIYKDMVNWIIRTKPNGA
jgi:cytidylate kinase